MSASGEDFLRLGQALGFGVAPLERPTLTEPPGPPPAAEIPAPPSVPMAATPPPAPIVPRARPPVGPGGVPTYAQGYQQLAAASADEQAAIDAAARAKGAAEEARGQTLMQGLAEQRQRLAEDARARAQASADVNQRMRQAYAEIDAMPKIDPSRLYNEASTAQKIAGALAIGVGGYLAGREGKNSAYEIIKGQIDNDLRAQMADLQSKQGAIAAKGSLLSQLMAEGRDQAEARHLANVAQWNMTLQEADARANLLGTPKALADAQLLHARSRQDLAKEASALRAHLDTKAQQDATLGLQRQREDREAAHQKFAEEFETTKLALEHGDKQAALEAKKKAVGAGGLPESMAGMTPKEIREVTVRDSKGDVIGYAASREDAGKVKERINNYEDYRDDLKFYGELTQKNGRKFGGLPFTEIAQSPDYADMVSVHERLLMRLKDMEKLGVLSEGDAKRLMRQIPGPRSWTSGGADPLPAIRESLTSSDKSMDKFVRRNIEGATRYSPPHLEDFGGKPGALPAERTVGRSFPKDEDPATAAIKSSLLQGPSLSLGGWMGR
jgi:hypothetical protein